MGIDPATAIVHTSRLAIAGFILVCLLSEPTNGIKVFAKGSVARERVDAIFLQCDVTNFGPEDEIMRVTWRHNDTYQGGWNDIFTVDLTNDAPAYFFFSQWAGRGQYNPISLATVMLTAPYVTRYLAGSYRCDVETSNTHGYAHAVVDVFYGPGTSIVITPGGRVQRKEGEELQLTCHAHCNPSCSYRWYKSGRRLSMSPSLRMKSVSRHEAGLYACQARNEAGRSIKPVEIRVLYPPVILALTSVPSETRLRNSSRTNVTFNNIDSQQGIVLQCRTQAWPEQEIQWFKGSNPLHNSTHPQGVHITFWSVDIEHKTSQLNILNATCLDSGKYSCKAHNPIGDSTTQFINVTTNCLPYEVTDPELCPFVSSTNIQRQNKTTVEMEKKLGSEVVIYFCFTGHPVPTVQLVRKTKHSHEVRTIQEPEFSCKGDTNICTVEYSFIITSPFLYGRYEVIVSNNKGSFTKIYRIVSRQAPQPPKNITISRVTSTSTCISWTPGYNGGSEQLFKLTYTPHFDGKDDRNTGPKYVTLEENMTSTRKENDPSGVFSVINAGNDLSKTTNVNDAVFAHEAENKTNPHLTSINSQTQSPLLYTACISNLSVSSIYSVQIEASNVYGKSRLPDVKIFKTLETTTTSTTETTPFPTTTTTTTPTRKTSTLTITKSTTTSTGLAKYTSFNTPTTTTMNTLSDILGLLHHVQGNFEHLPVYHDNQGTEDAIPRKGSANSNHLNNIPSSSGGPTHTMTYTEDESFWNADEDDAKYFHIEHNNNNNIFKENKNKDGDIVNDNYDNNNNDNHGENSNTNDNRDIIDEDYDDEEDEDIYDDDDYSEESKLFRVLSLYFKEIILKKERNTMTPQNHSNNYTKAPQGPFEVGRYFKKYVQIEKQKHIPISDNVYPFDKSQFHLRKSQEPVNTESPKLDISTKESPQTSESYLLLTSSVSIGTAFLVLILIIVVILIVIKTKRRHSPLSNKMSVSSPIYRSHGNNINSTQHSTAPPSIVRSVSSTQYHIHNSHTNQASPNSTRHNTVSPNLETSIHAPRNINNNTNNTTRDATCQSRLHSDDKKTTAKKLSINNRPRLSTPKPHRKDHQKCTYANSNSSTTSLRVALTPTAPLASLTSSLSSKLSPPPPPSSSSSSSTTTPSTSLHLNNSTLTIPGISINSKRISSPSYLEICTGSASSSDYEHRFCSDSALPQENADGSSCLNGKINDPDPIRRSSYSSIIIPSDVMDNSDKLDTTNKWNSYLDLCDTLSVRSGSRSPSNIYDPLDLSDKCSIRSMASYMAPHTPELVRKVLEENHFKQIMNQNKDEKDLNQKSPMATTKSVLNKKKLNGETNEGDNNSLFHYEQCVSLSYDKDEIERIKEKRLGIKTEESKAKELIPVSDTLKPACTTPSVVYMNERNGKHRCSMAKSPCSSNQHPNNNIICGSFNTEKNTNNSIYNEIDIHCKEYESDFDVKQKDNALTKHRGNCNTPNSSIEKKKKITNKRHHTNKESQKFQSKCKSSSLKENKETPQPQTNKNESKVSDAIECKNKNNSMHQRIVKNIRKTTKDISVKVQKRPEDSQEVKKFEDVSRKDSNSHYYSDIDTKDEDISVCEPSRTNTISDLRTENNCVYQNTTRND